MNIYVARQPIFDTDYQVIGYELLYRDSDRNLHESNMADNVATSLLLMNSYFTFGIDNLVGEHKAFINFDKHLVHLGVPELLQKERVVIEILEHVEPDYRFLKELKKLKTLGYTLAIDDFDLDYNYHEVIDLMDIIKVDFSKSKNESINEIATKYHSRGKQLLAEKVETKEAFEYAKALGFEYFQGYYFARPSIETKKTMDSNGLQYVKLMNELNNEEPDFHKLSKIISIDVTLTYNLLRLVNTNAKPVSEITSIQQAIAVLGVKQFRKWLSLAMVQQMSNKKVAEAVKYALIRSHLLVLIAQTSDLKSLEDELSLLGILSILDVMLEMPMNEALESLPIHDEMKRTLLGEETKYADAMNLCFAYEKGIFDEAQEAADRIHYTIDVLPEHYVQSISWAEKTYRELRG